MNCSLIAWAATPNASLAGFWSSAKKPINFCFAELKTIRWVLCVDVAIDWSFAYFLRNTVRVSAKFSLLGLLTFLNVRKALPRMREWKECILTSSVSFFVIFQTFWNILWNNSILFDVLSKIDIVVVRDLGNFDILLMLLFKFAELRFLANY